MQHPSSMTSQLRAIVGDEADGPGAHTAVLVCDDSTDVWAYATRSRRGTQADLKGVTDVSFTPEEYAHKLAAVAMTAWRHRRAKPARTGGVTGAAARNGRSPHRFSDTSSPPDNTSSSEAPKSSARGSTYPTTLTVSDNDDRWDPDPNDSDGPMLIECDDGRLLLYPMPSRKSGRDDRRRGNRLLRPPPSQHGSRHPSFAQSNRSLSGEATPTKFVLNQLRSSVTTDDHGETVCSTEDDTDRDSLRSDSINKNDSSSPFLLVLNADTTTWNTLLQQARAFAEVGSATSPAPGARSPRSLVEA